MEAERKKNDKERKDLENEIALLRSDLYSGSKSQQSGRSAEEVGANDGRDDFDGTDASLPEANRKDDVFSEANSDGEKSEKSQSEEPDNYLHKFWKQVFAYRNDGEYSIDNLAAERAIRPQTIQRKGSLFFGSVQGALRSAMYNTFIRTCKQVGVSFRQYFKALLKAVKSGRTDYENLLPMTICLD